MSARRISATAYQALNEALAYSFWYISSLERFIRVELRDYPDIISQIDFRQSKRKVANQAVELLMSNEPKCQRTILDVMTTLANLKSFPELEQLEDRDKWLPKGMASVANLKQIVQQYEMLQDVSDWQAEDREQYKQQMAYTRKMSDELDRLKNLFLSMYAMPDAHQRGRDLESFLNDLFALHDLNPRLAYVHGSEQIDGAFTHDTDDYILEAKWTSRPMSREQVDAFAAKVRRKGKNALGLIVSVNGLSGDARQTYSQSTPFITMDGSDLMHVLEGRFELPYVLTCKKRHANETGECHFPLGLI